MDERRKENQSIQALREEIKEFYERTTQNYGALRSDVMDLKETLYGDSRGKGMSQKVDEMYEIMTQMKGVKWFFAGLVLLGAALTTLKMWIFTK